MYAVAPRTSCASAPAIMGLVAGEGTRGELIYGKPHAGVEVHRSSTVGLLLIETPTIASVPRKVVGRA